MGTEKRVDYAAAYRQFLNYGNGHSLKEFCDTEDYDYNRLRRYATKSFWSQQMNHSNATFGTASIIPLEVESEGVNTKSYINRKEVSRSEEKDVFDGDGSSLTSQDVSCGSGASSVKDQNGKKNVNARVDY